MVWLVFQCLFVQRHGRRRVVLQFAHTGQGHQGLRVLRLHGQGFLQQFDCGVQCLLIHRQVGLPEQAPKAGGRLQVAPFFLR